MFGVKTSDERSTRRPVQPSTAQDMGVHVKDALSRSLSTVDDDPIARLSQVSIASDCRRSYENLADHLLITIFQVIER